MQATFNQQNIDNLIFEAEKAIVARGQYDQYFHKLNHLLKRLKQIQEQGFESVKLNDEELYLIFG